MSSDVCYNPGNYYDKSYGICYSPDATPYTPPPPPPDGLNKPVWSHPAASQINKQKLMDDFRSYYSDLSKSERDQKMKSVSEWKLADLLRIISLIDEQKDKVEDVKKKLFPHLDELRTLAKTMLSESLSPSTKSALQAGEVEFFTPERFVAVKDAPAWDESNAAVKNQFLAAYKAYLTSERSDVEGNLKKAGAWKLEDLVRIINLIETNKEDKSVKAHLLPLLPALKQVIAAKVKPVEELSKEEQLLFNILDQIKKEREADKTADKSKEKTPQQSVESFIKENHGAANRVELVKRAKEELEFYKKNFKSDQGTFIEHYNKVLGLQNSTGKSIPALKAGSASERKIIGKWQAYLESKLTAEQKEGLKREAQDRALDAYSDQPDHRAQFTHYRQLQKDLKKLEGDLIEKKYILRNLDKILERQKSDASPAQRKEIKARIEKEIKGLEEKKAAFDSKDPAKPGTLERERTRLIGIFKGRLSFKEDFDQNYLNLLWEKTRTGVQYFNSKEFGKPETLKLFTEIYGINPENMDGWETNLTNLSKEEPDDNDFLYGQFLFIGRIKGGESSLTLEKIRNLNYKEERELLAKLDKGELTKAEWEKTWSEWTRQAEDEKNKPIDKRENFKKLLGEGNRIILEGDMVIRMTKVEKEDRWVPTSNGARRIYINNEGILKLAKGMLQKDPIIPFTNLTEGKKDEDGLRFHITYYWDKALKTLNNSQVVEGKTIYEENKTPVYAALKQKTRPDEEARYNYRPLSDTGYEGQEKVLRASSRALGRMDQKTFSPKIALDLGEAMIRSQVGLKTWSEDEVVEFGRNIGLSPKQIGALKPILLGQAQLIVKGEVRGDKLDPEKKTRFFVLDKESKKMRELDEEEKAGLEKIFITFSQGKYQTEKDKSGAFLQFYGSDLPMTASSAFNKNLGAQIAVQLGRMGVKDMVRQWSDENRREFFTGLGDILTKMKEREQVDDDKAYYSVVTNWANSRTDQITARIKQLEKNKPPKYEETIKELNQKKALVDTLKNIYNALGRDLIKEKVLKEFRTLNVDLSTNVLQEIGYFVMEYLKADNLYELDKPIMPKDPKAPPKTADKEVKTRYFALDSITLQDVCERLNSQVSSGRIAAASSSAEAVADQALDAVDGRQESLAKSTSHYTWIWQHPGAVVNLFFAGNIPGYTNAYEVSGSNVVVKTEINANDLRTLAKSEDKPEGSDKAKLLRSAARILADRKLVLGEEIFDGATLNKKFLKQKGLEDSEIQTLNKTVSYLKDWHDNISRISQPVSGIQYEEILKQRLKKEVKKNYVGEWIEAMKEIPAPVIAKKMSMIESEKILALKQVLFKDEVEALRNNQKGAFAAFVANTQRSEEYFQGRQVFYIDGDFIIRFAQNYGHLLGSSLVDFLVQGKEDETLRDARGHKISDPKQFLIEYGTKLKAQKKTIKLSLDDSSDDASDRSAKLFIQGGLALWDPKASDSKDLDPVRAFALRNFKDAKHTTMAQVLGMDDTRINYPLRFKAGLIQWGYKWNGDFSLTNTAISAQQIRFAGEKFEEIWKSLDTTSKGELLKALKVKEETILHYISEMKNAKADLPALSFTDQGKSSLHKGMVFFVRNVIPNFVPSAEGKFASNIVDMPLKLAAETKGKKLVFGGTQARREGEKIPTEESWLARKAAKAKEGTHVLGFFGKSVHFGVFMHPTIQLSLQGGLIARTYMAIKSGDNKYAKEAYSELIKTRLGFLAFQYNPLALVQSGVNNLQQGNIIGAVVDTKFALDSLRNIRRAKGLLPAGFGIYLLYSGTTDMTANDKYVKGALEIAIGCYLIHSQVAALEKMLPEMKAAFKAGEYRKFIAGLETEMTDVIRTKATSYFEGQLKGMSPAEAELTKKRIGWKLLRMGRQVFSAIKDFGIEPLAKTIQSWQKLTGRKMPTFWKNMIIFAKNPNQVFKVEGTIEDVVRDNTGKPILDEKGEPIRQARAVTFKAKGWHLVSLYRQGIDPSLAMRAATSMVIGTQNTQKISNTINSIENRNIVAELVRLNGSPEGAQQALQAIQAEAGKVQEGVLRREGSLPRVIAKQLFHAIFATNTEKFMARSIHHAMAFEDILPDAVKEYKEIEKMLKKNMLGETIFKDWKTLYREYGSSPMIDNLIQEYNIRGKTPEHSRQIAAKVIFQQIKEGKSKMIITLIEDAARSPEHPALTPQEHEAFEKRGYLTQAEAKKIFEYEKSNIVAQLAEVEHEIVDRLQTTRPISGPSRALSGQTAPQLPPAFELKSALKAAGLKKVILGKSFEGIDQSVQERLVAAAKKAGIKKLIISENVNFAHGGETSLNSLIEAMEKGQVGKTVRIFAAQDGIHAKGIKLNPSRMSMVATGALEMINIQLGANGLRPSVAAQLNVCPADIQARYNVSAEDAVKIAEDVKAVKSTWLQAKENALQRITELEKKGTLTPERAKLMRETASVSWDAEIAKVESAAVEKSAIEKLQAQAEQLRRDIKPLEETVKKAATPEARLALKSKIDELKVKTGQLAELDHSIGTRIRGFAKTHGVMLGILVGITIIKNSKDLFSKRTLEELGQMGLGFAIFAASQNVVERGLVRFARFGEGAGTAAGGAIPAFVTGYGHLSNGHFSSSADPGVQLLAGLDMVKEGFKGAIAFKAGAAAAAATGWSGVGAVGVGAAVGIGVYEILTLAETLPGVKGWMDKKFTAEEIRTAFRNMKAFGELKLKIEKPDDDDFFTKPTITVKDGAGKEMKITQAQYMMVLLKTVAEVRTMSKTAEMEYIKKVGPAKAKETIAMLEAFQNVDEVVIDQYSTLDPDVLPAMLKAVSEFAKKHPLGDRGRSGYNHLTLEIGKRQEEIIHPDGKIAGRKAIYNISVSGQSYSYGMGGSIHVAGEKRNVGAGDSPASFSYKVESFTHEVYSGDSLRLQEGLVAQKYPEAVTLQSITRDGASISFDQLDRFPMVKEELAARLKLLGYDVTENVGGRQIYEFNNGKMTPRPVKITTSSLWQAYEKFLLDEGFAFPEEISGTMANIRAMDRDQTEISPLPDGLIIELPERTSAKRIANGNMEYRGTTLLHSDGVKHLFKLTGVKQPEELLADTTEEGEKHNG